MGFVLLASFFQGILDLLLIAFLARFVGLFSGAKLADRLPGIWVFGGGILDQTGWLLALLIASFWLTSFVRFSVSLMQSLLSAEIWNDLVNQVYQNVLRQRYEFFIENRTANLSDFDLNHDSPPLLRDGRGRWLLEEVPPEGGIR